MYLGDYQNSILASNFFSSNCRKWISYNDRSIYIAAVLCISGGCNNEDEHQPPTVLILASRRKIMDESIYGSLIFHALICIINHTFFYPTLSLNNCYNSSQTFCYQAL